MGYSITLGEARIGYYPEDEYMKIEAEGMVHDDAPDLGRGDISGKSNQRHPSYTAFKKWCDETGLLEVFYETDDYKTEQRRMMGWEDPVYWQIKGGHPGATPITRDMYKKVKSALTKYRKKHPNAIMPSPENTEGFGPNALMTGEGMEHLDYTLGRLVWFEFWMRWALENCKHPIIANS